MDGGTWLGYNPWGHKESDTTERLPSLTPSCLYTLLFFFICFFGPHSSLHIIHVDVFGTGLISVLPRIPPEGGTQRSVPILTLVGLWVVGSSGCCDKDSTDKSFGACYSRRTWGVESERIFSILKIFLDKTC